MSVLDGEYVDCRHCGGSGDDDSDWSGKCPFCNGSGEVWREYSDPDEDDNP